MWKVRIRSSCICSDTAALFIELQHLLPPFQEAQSPLSLCAGSTAATVLQHWSWRIHSRTPNCGFALKKRTSRLTNSSVSTTVPKLGRRRRSDHPSGEWEVLCLFDDSLFPGDIFRSSQPSLLPLSSVRLRKMSIISVYPIVSSYNSRRHTCGKGTATPVPGLTGPLWGKPKARAGWAPVGTTVHTHSRLSGRFYSQCKVIMCNRKPKCFFLFF